MRTVLLFLSVFIFGILWSQTETPVPKEEKNYLNNELEPATNSVQEEIEVLDEKQKNAEGKKQDLYLKGTLNKRGKSKAPAPVSNQQKIKISQQLFEQYENARENSNSPKSRSIADEDQQKLNNLVSKMESTNALSFEYNLAKYVNGNHDVANFSYLNKAYELNKNSQEAVQLMLAYYEITSDKNKRKEFSQQLKALNVFSKETYAYLKNVLNSVPVNGILITHGSLDTYPIFVLMDTESFRTDVRVVSLDFLQSEAYRSKIKNQGVSLPESTVINTAYFKNLCDLNKVKQLYLSFTIPKNYFQEIQSNLYVSGLSFQYSPVKKNNMEILIINWNKFDKSIFEFESAPNNESKQLISNYLVPLVLLKKHYQKENKFGKAEEMGAYISKVAEWKSKEKTVEKILSN